jgi:hypothetical protein
MCRFWYIWHLGGLRTRRLENFSSAELDEISWLASYANSRIIEKRVNQNEEGPSVPLSRFSFGNEGSRHLQGPLTILEFSMLKAVILFPALPLKALDSS